MILNKTETRRRKNRAFKKTLEYITNYKCLFITLTFNPKIKANNETKKKYLKAFLREQTTHYIANADYSKEKKLLHFHAVAVVSDYTKEQLKHYRDSRELWNYKDSINFKKWTYGLINAERIKYQNGKEQETAERLRDHYFKETTITKNKVEKLIYSKGQKPLKDQIKRTREYINDNHIIPICDRKALKDLIKENNNDFKKGQKLLNEISKKAD